MRTRTPRRPPRQAVLARGALACLLALAALAVPVPVAGWAAEGDDPNLDQTLSELPIVHGQRVLETGHVDMGPKFDAETWRFLVHDDVAKADSNATSVWRYPDETVLRVLDQARLTVPDDSAYSFIGAAPGSPVWVVPQTQNPDVVWLGWNTQDPRVMKSIDRGITLSLAGVQGPGTVTVYLHSGSFGKPQVLWDSRESQAQPVWVDVNTHTHANWVFTQPGVYLLRLTAQADLIDGRHVSDTQLIRFAVGTATPVGEALAAAWQGAVPADASGSPQAVPSGGSGAARDGAASAEPERGLTVPILIATIVVLAAALIGGSIVVIVRGNRAKRRVLSSRTDADAGQDSGDAR